MLPVVTPEEMAAIDAAAPEPVEVLIERAGAAAARAALRLLGGGYGRRVVVLAGRGNNGADGRVAASRLARRGVRCLVLDVGAAPEVLPVADLVVDAAYGTGVRSGRAWSAPRLADPATPVLAIDLPSGVDGLTGEVLVDAVLPATATITFGALKPGLLLGPGRLLAGPVEVAGLGLDVSAARAFVVTDEDAARWWPRRGADAHKWRQAVEVVAGSPGMTGAAHLAARAAQRAGAGMVRLRTPGVDADPQAPTEAVGLPTSATGWAPQVLAEVGRVHALVVGPGLGRAAGVDDDVAGLLAGTDRPAVVDGDGLSALAARRDALGARRERAVATVLTPHDGEYERLAGRPPGADRFAAARSLAASTGAVVLLKGPTTVVADPDGLALAVTAGDARLATAGTGDVLAGAIGALLAGGLGPLEAAALGAHLHARAACLGSPVGLVAGDLPDLLPAALAALPSGSRSCPPPSPSARS